MRFNYSLILLAMLSYDSHATPIGWRGEAVIASRNGAPAICLPQNATEAFPISRVVLSESYVNTSLKWILALKGNFKPVTLKPGECFKFGDIPDGYELDKDSNISTLQKNRTYSFTIDRVNDSEHYNYFYSSAFCIEGNINNGYKYFQYIRLKDGSTIIPACDSKSKREARPWEK
ncbi:hypothetical protein [Pseudomonas denitrificans (nom. rej.)]|uniref:Uncharacterized protein n=1 Tax=Pseudomonas denitrificans TaxID=43306 RepID=A0A9X7MYA9_PSEDE|nr:hypothetical protein [Pseudomonas denitrificans (nom. rej.)]QEY71490.1 hypothetical protein F1C79_07545 [Pseudomonas denitrificans (nom. rej.)]